MQIIGIRYCDAKSKGVGNPSLEDGDLLRELSIQKFSLTNEVKQIPLSRCFCFLYVSGFFYPFLLAGKSCIDDSIENNILHSCFYYYLI